MMNGITSLNGWRICPKIWTLDFEWILCKYWLISSSLCGNKESCEKRKQTNERRKIFIACAQADCHMCSSMCVYRMNRRNRRKRVSARRTWKKGETKKMFRLVFVAYFGREPSLLHLFIMYRRAFSIFVTIFAYANECVWKKIEEKKNSHIEEAWIWFRI